MRLVHHADRGIALGSLKNAEAFALERLPENPKKMTIDIDTQHGCSQVTHVA